MRVHLAYGEKGLEIDLPDGIDVMVVEPRHARGLPSPAAALTEALRRPIGAPPLRELAKPGQKIGIVFSDITRAAPHRLILPAVLAELEHVPRGNITLFNALGTHRPNTDAELRAMIGSDLADSYPLIQNDAFNPAAQIRLGRTSLGHEIRLNRDLSGCDLKILTGFIEPHLFAGFSGGGKALMPGMAGIETILGNHDARMIAHPNAVWGVTRGNPIWEEILEVARAAGPSFLVNVTLNRDRAVTGVFAGALEAAHAEGCAFAATTAIVTVPRPFDIVITTNSGFPLDLNLYQSIKGLSAGARVVKPGGDIILAAECRDGVPEHGMFGRILRGTRNPRELLDRILAPGFLEQDQWQAQILAQTLLRANVHMRSDGLSDDDIRSGLMTPSRDIAKTVGTLAGARGPGVKVCVLPQGPLTIPRVELSESRKAARP
jgi:lactate racemase